MCRNHSYASLDSGVEIMRVSTLATLTKESRDMSPQKIDFGVRKLLESNYVQFHIIDEKMRTRVAKLLLKLVRSWVRTQVTKD